MPRPKKCRRVCMLPRASAFVPVGCGQYSGEVTMTVDEYESVRLIDYEGLSQEECSNYMSIARTTVQLIYNRARRKLARALVEGLPLKIEGGDYRLCDESGPCRGGHGGHGGCHRHCQQRRGASAPGQEETDENCNPD